MDASGPITVHIDPEEDQTIRVDPDTGTIEHLQPDGGVVVQLDARRPKSDDDGEDDWFRNLVDDVAGIRLSTITNDLIEGIKADDSSRLTKLTDISRGLGLLGLEIQEPSSDVSDVSSGPQISKVTNPLLLEAIMKGWANAEAELLPASGPAKIKSDGQESAQEDTDAEILERGVNHYLTVTATEYYPETSHMLLWGTYFGGAGFKKVYRCPMRRRPVSEMVETKDLIVSNAMKDFRSCGRITHQLTMRPSVFKRMQLLGAYRKTGGAQPNPEPNAVDTKVGAIQGVAPTPDRPEDKPYTIWETQCELDLDEFVPKKSKFKGEGIPLPYLVTIDKDNEEILAVRRDWDENDEHCTRLRMYVKYPYVPGPGFYGTGMLNILGNASAAMTAAWRECLDTGMYANFPGGFVSKLGGRQINTDMKLGPGEWRAIETGGQPIAQVMMGNPYKDVTPGLLSLMDKITEQCKALGQGIEVQVSEGVKDVPVGSMIAQVEQSTKIMLAAHKGMHNAQKEEISLLVALFKKHPEDLVNSDDDSPFEGWDGERLIQALNDHKLVPVSDPNVPSHIHRVAKALGIVQLFNMPQFAARLDPDEALRRVLGAMREDPIGLQVPAPPQQAAPDLGDQAKMIDAQAKSRKVDSDIANKATDTAMKQQELQSDQAIHAMDFQKEQVIHSADAEKAQLDADKVKADVQGKQADTALGIRKQMHDEKVHQDDHSLESFKAGVDAQQKQHDQRMGVAAHSLEAQNSAASHALETQRAGTESEKTATDGAVKVHQALNPPKPAAPKPSKGKK